MGNLQISDIPFTDVVTTLHEDVTISICCLVVNSAFYPFSRDGELAVRGLAKAQHRNVLSNGTLDLEVERVGHANLCIDTTDGEELAVPRRICSLRTLEVQATIFDRETGKSGLAASPAGESDLRDVTVLREVHFCIDYLYSLCSQEACQESKKSK